MLPEIEQKLRLAFCRLDPEAREDAMEEGVVHSLLAYVRLLSKAERKSQPHHRLLGTARDM